MSLLALVVSILVALAMGVVLGITKASLPLRGSVFCCLYLLSIGLQTLATPGLEASFRTFVSLLVLGAIPALVCHVLPAMVAYSVTLFIRKRRRSSGF